MKLEVKLRKNAQGVTCAAPFINGFNVWDIPLKEWTPAVQDAVKHAYELGAEHAVNTVCTAGARAVWATIDTRQGFPKPEKEIK